ILDLDELMPRVVNLIKEQFGYDHVQIFLMDNANEYAELRASTGEAGEQLLSISHKLARGSQSVIGQVTANGRPEIALDTSDARVVHRPNPYLPLTRSEMALPILIKGEVIGALDVQSNQPNAFGDDDVAVLTTLAAQVSVAIDNARLFDQAESRADEMSFLFTITTAAASADNLEEAMQNVVELLRGSLNTLSIGIYLLREEEEEVDYAVSQAPPTQQDKYMRIVALAGSDQPLSEVEDVRVGDETNLIGIVSEELTPVIVDDIREESRYLPLVSSARSAVIVPQHAAGQIIGLIAMESERAYQYNQDTLTLLLALSSTLAAIVQNQQLINEVVEANEELKTLDRLKSDFLANMSHELRTPLNSIIGFSRVMLKGIDGDLTDMQEQDLTTIYNSGQHLLGLINDILDTAKIQAEKMDLQKDYFDAKMVVDGVRSIGIGLVKEKPVDILLETANNLPMAFGDEFRTRQVLLNIVSNAAKFTSEGRITMSVYTVQDEHDNTMIRVDVADTGIGIAEKDIPTLFEAFRQVDSSLTRTVEGTGLGLPIAKSLVELQGGEMFVQSEINVGSTFSITIPIQPMQVVVDEDGEVIGRVPVEDPEDAVEVSSTQEMEELEDAPASESSEPEPATATSTGSMNKVGVGAPPPGIFQQKRQILIIEDNPQMVDQFRRMLQREGFEVQVANHPMFAETMASGLRPTLIIMDVNFAEGKGWEILQRLKDRDDTFDIPVIVVTMNDESERAYQLGAYDFIQRPYTPDALLESVLKAEQESNVDRILIIDDQTESSRLIEQLLSEHGQYRVFAAHTGPEGISLIARRRPNLVILDLRMPEMDGFAVLEELRKQPETASIPVVVVTSETSLTEGERAQLTDLQIIYKTDLNQENYQHFIDEVKRQISDYHGDS
ncbi:MAG: response regulator, partial [Chloroflexota bacterium]